jgi:hypothetical protein
MYELFVRLSFLIETVESSHVAEAALPRATLIVKSVIGFVFITTTVVVFPEVQAVTLALLIPLI